MSTQLIPTLITNLLLLFFQLPLIVPSLSSVLLCVAVDITLEIIHVCAFYKTFLVSTQITYLLLQFVQLPLKVRSLSSVLLRVEVDTENNTYYYMYVPSIILVTYTVKNELL